MYAHEARNLIAKLKPELEYKTNRIEFVGHYRLGGREFENVQAVYLPKTKTRIVQHGMFEDVTIEVELKIEDMNGQIILHKANPFSYGWKVIRMTGPDEFVSMLENEILVKHWHIVEDEIHMHEMGGTPGQRQPCKKEECKKRMYRADELEIFYRLGLPFIIPEGRTTKLLGSIIKRNRSQWRMGIKEIQSM